MNGRRHSRLAVYGMLTGLAFVLSYVESLIPVPIPIPGVKLGLANLVTITGLYTVGVRGTAAVSLARILLAGLTFSGLSGMLYSLAGWGLSLGLMILARKTGWFSQTGVSIIGGVGHNVGQLAAAALIVETMEVFYYLPVLLAAGCIAGALIGLLAGLVTARIQAAAR